MNILPKGSHFYWVFVDLKRALDSINHNSLWHKLPKVGFNGKLFRTLRTLYNDANLKININNQLSEPINITEGLLLGESASPILLLLYLSDLINHLNANGVRGVKILKKKKGLFLLMFADDIVILANSAMKLEMKWQTKLDPCKSYCRINGLTLNPDKTKVMPFHRSPKLTKLNKQLKWGNSTISYTKNYTYLGVPFASSGKFT